MIAENGLIDNKKVEKLLTNIKKIHIFLKTDNMQKK
jgi:hypothetical protein